MAAAGVGAVPAQRVCCAADAEMNKIGGRGVGERTEAGCSGRGRRREAQATSRVAVRRLAGAQRSTRAAQAPGRHDGVRRRELSTRPARAGGAAPGVMRPARSLAASANAASRGSGASGACAVRMTPAGAGSEAWQPPERACSAAGGSSQCSKALARPRRSPHAQGREGETAAGASPQAARCSSQRSAAERRGSDGGGGRCAGLQRRGRLHLGPSQAKAKLKLQAHPPVQRPRSSPDIPHSPQRAPLRTHLAHTRPWIPFLVLSSSLRPLARPHLAFPRPDGSPDVVPAPPRSHTRVASAARRLASLRPLPAISAPLLWRSSRRCNAGDRGTSLPGLDVGCAPELRACHACERSAAAAPLASAARRPLPCRAAIRHAELPEHI
jgi:hypothetical protein